MTNVTVVCFSNPWIGCRFVLAMFINTQTWHERKRSSFKASTNMFINIYHSQIHVMISGGGISSFEWNQLKPRRGSTPTPPLLTQCQSSIIIDNLELQLYIMIINSSRWLVEVRVYIGGQSPVFFKSWFHLTSEGGYGDTASSYIIPPWMIWLFYFTLNAYCGIQPLKLKSNIEA